MNEEQNTTQKPDAANQVNTPVRSLRRQKQAVSFLVDILKDQLIYPPPSWLEALEDTGSNASEYPVEQNVMAQELYNTLENLISPNGDYRHEKYLGTIDLIITGENLNNALDVLKKYKDKLAL